MSKSLSWMALAVMAVALAAGALLFAQNSFAGSGAGLANTRWSLVSINGQAPIAGRALTLNFQSSNQLTGDSGCNGYGGQYQVRGKTIAVSQLVSTLRACAEQLLNDQEATFQKALSDAAQFSLQGGQLTLKNASGGEVLVFQKQ
jgi:heat shock protein HslJ